MSLENARQFVDSMRQQEAFRADVCQAAAAQQMAALLEDYDYNFELHHLVMAMAECMDEMAQA